MPARGLSDKSPSFETHDLVSWMHDMTVLVRNLDSCTDLLASADLDAATRKVVYRSASRTISLLKEMLPNAHRLGRARRPRQSTCDLRVATGTCVDMFWHQSRRTGVVLDFDRSIESMVVKGNDLILKRVISNLILNGMEASAPGGRVSVKMTRAGRSVVLAVADSGTGMPRSVRSQIFKRPITTKRTGGGRGLMLAATTVAAQGGTIAVETERGKGTIVTLTLPAALSSRQDVKMRN